MNTARSCSRRSGRTSGCWGWGRDQQVRGPRSEVRGSGGPGSRLASTPDLGLRTSDPFMTGPSATSTTARTLDRAAGSRPIPGNDVELLIDGPDTFRAMLKAIARAERWIHFENYIIRSDATGWRFAEALAAKAKAGVRVRVLADWFGSMGTRRKYWRFLRAAGCEVRLFSPLDLFDPIENISRDHRKLVSVDGHEAIVGGLCIGDEWAGDQGRAILPWRDTAVRVCGPAAAALDLTFGRTWGLAGGTIPSDDRPGR